MEKNPGHEKSGETSAPHGDPEPESGVKTLAVLITVIAILSLLSWGVETLLEPGISVPGYAGAIIISSAMVFFTLMALKKGGALS